MNTSEVLDLSKENIQPLKQGRNAVKLGTALQAQTNSDLQQKLLAEREEFELLIRMYDGDDPLKPHYDYVYWIEQSFPKHGPESNIVQILENTLTTFKDDERYKQDLRYAELLIKYIDTQPNPLELYQIVYNQGLCTMCAPFYKAWADELDKNNDIKNADQIYELGKKVKAQPIAILEEGHLRFQLSVGRRMLGHQEEASEVDPDYNRQALYKIEKKNIHSVRDPVGAPGRIKQSLTSHNSQNAPFKVYQGDDNEDNMYSDSQGKMFPKQKLLNKENTLKVGPWTQNKGKIHSRVQVPTSLTPAFQVHEDEEGSAGSRHPKTPSVPGALKTRKKDYFTCPLAIFESPDPTKKPMYCKNKVYAGGREFQFEELRAALYNRRHEQLIALRLQEIPKQEIQSPVEVNIPQDDNKNILSDNNPVNGEFGDVKQDLISGGTQLSHGDNVQPPHDSSQDDVKPDLHSDMIKEDKQSIPVEIPVIKIREPSFENKITSLETNTSLFHSQSFTVNTKEAMNVVQEMWNSPSPSPAFARNPRASVYPTSPVGLDESGVFKVPPVPPPLGRTEVVTTPTQTYKVAPTPSFPIFSDDEPETGPSQAFQIYSDDNESEKIQSKNEIVQLSEPNKNEITKDNQNCGLQGQLFNPIMQPPKSHYEGDPATLKMLAFQSDSDDSADEIVLSNKRDDKKNKPLSLQNNIATVPVVEKNRKSFGLCQLPPTFHDEEKFEDMTCNTKAFEFVLPSSTPLVGHLKSSNTHHEMNCINGSYIAEEIKKIHTKQDLSMIFEASKERYSSSSGSSGCKTQGSVCTVASTSIQPAQAELLEKLDRISENNELERSIGLLNISGEVDPFSTELITQFLSHIGYPKKHHMIGLHRMETEAPQIHSNSTAKLGSTKYSIICELGKGNYARVVKATRDGQPVALKQQRPPWEWEWYIIRELQNRVSPNMMDFYLHVSNGYVYKNASIFESEWAQHGTILSVVNKLKLDGKGHDLYLAMLFSIQMILIVEYLHKCKIIHGDVKPDNFVLYNLPKSNVNDPCLKLIDFGRAIDMTLFPEGTTFTKVVTTDAFQCNEMKEGRPWTYQTDLYGLAGSIYCVLFYDYMKVIKKGTKWQLSQKIPRYMKPAVWEEIFSVLLNIESCDKLPDLSALRESLEKHCTLDQSNSQLSLNKLNNMLLRK